MDDDDDVKQGEGADEAAGESALGDAGKKALDEMKGKWHSSRDEAKELRAQLEALKGKSEAPKEDVAALREQLRGELQAGVMRDRALDRIEAKAAALFADPEDAVALLRDKVDDFIVDGKLDNGEIMGALKGLLERKPHLAATAQARFTGDGDGGARKGSKPDQLTRDDLKKMTPEQIVKAQSDGRLSDLMGI